MLQQLFASRKHLAVDHDEARESAQSLRAKLFQHVSPVYLDRSMRYSKFRAGLPAGTAMRDQHEYLPLARRQTLKLP